MARGRLHIGTAGYQYNHWAGAFYPDGLRKKDRFGHYAERFNALEVNGTFYSLPKPETFDAWEQAAPPGFVYCPKYSRYGSHLKRLKNPDQHVPNFCERAERLAGHLGPVLVQLPGNMKADARRLEAFLQAWPEDWRLAVEFRHESWLSKTVHDLLRRYDAAVVAHDMQDGMLKQAATADFVYLRLHGPAGDYCGGYTPQFLSARARAITAELDVGRDVYAFFNNDADAYAPDNAARLARYVVCT